MLQICYFSFIASLLCSWPCLRLSVVRRAMRACWLPRLHCSPEDRVGSGQPQMRLWAPGCPELEKIWKPQQISMSANAILTVCAYVFVRLLLPSSLWLRLALYSVLPCRTWAPRWSPCLGTVVGTLVALRVETCFLLAMPLRDLNSAWIRADVWGSAAHCWRRCSLTQLLFPRFTCYRIVCFLLAEYPDAYSLITYLSGPLFGAAHSPFPTTHSCLLAFPPRACFWVHLQAPSLQYGGTMEPDLPYCLHLEA